jgi:protein-S-isoprenylcysteine O-methyltransferase Ste14
MFALTRISQQAWVGENMQSRSHPLGDVQRVRKYTIAAACFIVAAMLFVTRPVYDSTYYGFWSEVVGIFLILGGFGIRLWCTLYIGGKKHRDLMTDGPYSLCRNPLYLGSILAASGIGLQTEMLTLGLLGGIACWAIFRVVVNREEAYLLAKFGDPYRRYCERTPRFFPRFSGYRDAEQRYFEPPKLWNTFRDGLALFAVIPITEAIEVAHRGEMLRALFHLY